MLGGPKLRPNKEATYGWSSADTPVLANEQSILKKAHNWKRKFVWWPRKANMDRGWIWMKYAWRGEAAMWDEVPRTLGGKYNDTRLTVREYVLWLTDGDYAWYTLSNRIRPDHRTETEDCDGEIR